MFAIFAFRNMLKNLFWRVLIFLLLVCVNFVHAWWLSFLSSKNARPGPVPVGELEKKFTTVNRPKAVRPIFWTNHAILMKFGHDVDINSTRFFFLVSLCPENASRQAN